jgi:predicted AlkP superfamily phosphohydrolase/phosphomutase
MRDLRARGDARFIALRYQGLDTIGHYYMGDTQPGVVADSNDHDRRRHVQVLERYYTYIDAEIGSALAALAPEDLLLVVSGFGMQRQSALKQIAGRLLGDPDMTGTHDRAPDGFLLAYGAAVQNGRLQRGSIVDVTPTVLYYFDLPVGRDMDGYARTDIFTPEFTAERPIAFIPSYSK